MATLATAGCYTTPAGDEVVVSFHGDINTTDNRTALNGEVSIGGRIPDRSEYRNITIYYLSENRSTTDSFEVGDIGEAPGNVNFSSSTSGRPAFIVINSPDFWQESMAVEYLEWEGEGYHIETATAESELPGFSNST